MLALLSGYRRLGLVFAAALVWYVACEVLGSCFRERNESGDFPTRASWLFKWLGPIGFVAILGIDFVLTILSRK